MYALCITVAAAFISWAHSAMMSPSDQWISAGYVDAILLALLLWILVRVLRTPVRRAVTLSAFYWAVSLAILLSNSGIETASTSALRLTITTSLLVGISVLMWVAVVVAMLFVLRFSSRNTNKRSGSI